MKHHLALFTIILIPLLLWKCNNSNQFSLSKDTLTAEFSGITEIYAGIDHYVKTDSLTQECLNGLEYLHFNTIIFSNDTLKWSTMNNETQEKEYFLYKYNISNDTLYGKFLGTENKGNIKNEEIQDNIVLIKNNDGFTTPFYYLKKTFHQQYFSFLPLEPLKKDYINTLDTITDSLKYWTITINFRLK